MELPIDTAVLKFAAAGPAEPVLDFATKAQKTDAQGMPIFAVPIFMIGRGIKNSISVKVSGEPKGLTEFVQVRCTGLTAFVWAVGDNNGVSFRAERVELVKAAS